jgi:hypothetical protein
LDNNGIVFSVLLSKHKIAFARSSGHVIRKAQFFLERIVGWGLAPMDKIPFHYYSKTDVELKKIFKTRIK